MVGISIPTRDIAASIRILQTALTDQQIDAIIVTDDDLLEIGAALAQYFHLPMNNPDAVRYARRKDLARICLQKAGISVPAFQLLSLQQQTVQDLTFAFPVVVKPLCLSASCGVIRANDAAQLQQALTRVQPIIESLPDAYEASHLLVEAYVDGDEYALEGILEQGQLTLLMLFDKPDSMEGPFFEETIYLTPSRLSPVMQQCALQYIQRVCQAYGLIEGPIHAEFRIDREGKIWLIDFAARTIGGQCAQLLEYALGIGLEELVIQNKLGIRLALPESATAAGVMMIPIPERGVLRRVEGILAAMQVPLIEDIQIMMPEGYELVPLPEGSSYLGFIFAKGDKVEEVESAIRKAYSHLHFVIAPSLPVRLS